MACGISDKLILFHVYHFCLKENQVADSPTNYGAEYNI